MPISKVDAAVRGYFEHLKRATLLRAAIVGVALLLAGCGNSAQDGEIIGQAKKVTHRTPLICPNYVAFDLSLGVMKGGTGSMSTQDMWFTVAHESDIEALTKAVQAGAIVRVKYDTRRIAICTEAEILTAVEIVP